MTPSELEQLASFLADAVAARLQEHDKNALVDAHRADALVDVHQAAALLGCSVPTVERLTRSGSIPSVKIGRLRRYDPSKLTENMKGGAA